MRNNDKSHCFIHIFLSYVHFEEKKQLVNQSEVVSAQKLYQEQIDNKAHAAELGLPRFRYFSVWFGFKVPITLEYF